VTFVLHLLAFVCFISIALGRTTVRSAHLGWLGLALWLLGNMIGGVAVLPPFR
jgi:hypothetical protein